MTTQDTAPVGSEAPVTTTTTAPGGGVPETSTAPIGSTGAEGAGAESTGTTTEQETFAREYVEQLRKEAAERRTALKPYEEAFGAYSPEERQFFFDVASGLASEDPAARAAAASRLKTVAEQLLGDVQEAQAEAERPLTKAELDQMLAQREAQARQEQQVQAVLDEAKALGYEPNTPGHADLLFRAANITNGDLNKAHEMIKAERQAIIDEWVKAKQEGREAFSTPPPEGVSPAPPSDAPKTLAEARARTRERVLREASAGATA